jgi:DNA-binding CsgD family transcriptional regulator/PAS domain-containing protein
MAMVTLADFSRIVSAVHAAAITPEHWIAAMEAVRAIFGSTSAAMITADGTSRVINSAYLPADAQRTYREHYHRVDYVLNAVEHGPVGLIRSGEPLVASNARSEFNADWLHPHGMQDGLFVRLTDGSLPTCFLIATSKGSEPYATPDRVRVVDALVPHLQQALRSKQLLDDLVHEARDLAEAVDSMRHGVFVVGQGGAVIHANRGAEDIVAAGDGVEVRSARLGLRVPAADAVLQRSIPEALGHCDSGGRSGSSMLCPRIEGKRSYVVHVVPFSPSTTDPNQSRALVIVIDPDRRTEPCRQLLSCLYGLTKAESEIALRVLDGDGLRPISDEMSLSMATVKTHLQHVFAKTGTHRQAELVRLLLTISP